MPDLIATGARWLADQRRRFMTREVEYLVGAVPTTVLAAIGRTEFEVVGDGGILERLESRDFIVAREDLPVPPERGHRIRETHDGVVHLFEVMAPVANRPAFRWADAERTAYRIHTRLIGTEST